MRKKHTCSHTQVIRRRRTSEDSGGSAAGGRPRSSSGGGGYSFGGYAVAAPAARLRRTFGSFVSSLVDLEGFSSPLR